MDIKLYLLNRLYKQRLYKRVDGRLIWSDFPMAREYIWRKKENGWMKGYRLYGYPIASSYVNGRCIHAQTLSKGTERFEPLGKGEYKHLILREDEIGQYWESVDEFHKRIATDEKVFSGETKVDPGYKAIKMVDGYREEWLLSKSGCWDRVS